MELLELRDGVEAVTQFLRFVALAACLLDCLFSFNFSQFFSDWPCLIPLCDDPYPPYSIHFSPPRLHTVASLWYLLPRWFRDQRDACITSYDHGP
jgi:hypothetical protein